MIPELIPLDSRAIDFLKEELRASPTLGRQLHELDLAKGTMVALVPTPKAGAIHDFRASIYDYGLVPGSAEIRERRQTDGYAASRPSSMAVG
jgi:hypothetical protein